MQLVYMYDGPMALHLQLKISIHHKLFMSLHDSRITSFTRLGDPGAFNPYLLY